MPILFRGAGGSALPELTKPATTQDVRSGKQFIDAEGSKQRGALNEYYFTDVYFALANASTAIAATCFAQTTTKVFSAMGGSILSAAGTLVLDFGDDEAATMTHAAIHNIYGSSNPFSTETGATKRVNCWIYDVSDSTNVTKVGSFALTVAADVWGSAPELSKLSKSITLESGKSYLVEMFQTT